MPTEAGTAFVTVLPNAAGFSALLQRQLAPATAKLETGFKGITQRLTGQVTGLGTSIGTSLGLGLGIAAIAAGKMALDFENAFTKIATLSNASAADIARWKVEVLSLSGETARAPQELADALFFLSSAGLESGQVMEALSASAKGAAVGLGSTVDVANITASALNAYAGSALTAAEVTDTLVAAVKAGRAEPEEFANSLGRLLPISVQAGVSFQDLTASLASLSNIGLDVNESATAMRGALQAIVAPGAMASAAMAQLGLSAQDLLDAISEHGLFGALQLLDQAARDNTSTQAEYIGVLRKVIPNVRALTGVLGLTGQEAEKVDALFAQVTDSTGALDTAFQEWLKGPGASFAKLFNDLKVAAIRFGEEILPIGRMLAQVISPALKLAADNAKLLLAVLLGYAALKFLPGLLLGISIAVEALGAASVAGGIFNVAAALEGVSAAAVAAGIGVAALITKVEGGEDTLRRTLGDDEIAIGIDAWVTAIRSGDATIEDAVAAFGRLEQAAAASPAAFAQVTMSADEMEAALRKALGSATGLPNAIRDGGAAADAAAISMEQLSVRIVRASVGLEAFTRLTGVDAIKVLTDFRAAVLEAGESEEKLAAASRAAVRQAKAVWEDWHDSIVQAFGGAGTALDVFADKANVDLGRATTRLNGYTREITVFGRNIASISDTFGNKANAFIQWATEQGLAQSGLVSSVANANRENARSFVQAFNAGEEATGSLADQIQDTLGRAFDTMITKLGAIKRAILGQPALNVDTSQANAALTSLQSRLQNLSNQEFLAHIGIVISSQGEIIHAATGFHGQISHPTLFLAGEAGSERIDITPGGARGGGGGGQIRGQLQVTDWHRGIVDLQGELDHADFVGAS